MPAVCERSIYLEEKEIDRVDFINEDTFEYIDTKPIFEYNVINYCGLMNDTGIFQEEKVYNDISSRKRRMVNDMYNTPDTSTYIKKSMCGLEAYIRLSEKDKAIYSIDRSTKIKSSILLRKISRDIIDSNIPTEYSKDSISAVLEFAARLMNILNGELDLQDKVSINKKNDLNFLEELSCLLTDNEADDLCEYLNRNKE